MLQRAREREANVTCRRKRGSWRGRGREPVGGACSQARRTQPCTCADGAPGRQSCDASLAWGACECAAANGLIIPNFEGNRRTDITFEWDRTATSGDLGGCLPGEYEGTFGGLYWSYLATLAPIEELFVPIANIAVPGEPSGFSASVLRSTLVR